MKRVDIKIECSKCKCATCRNMKLGVCSKGYNQCSNESRKDCSVIKCNKK